MAIQGQKPSGYFHTFDPSGRKVEGETRQCVHCGRTWVYMPQDKRIIKVLVNAEKEVKKQRGLCTACHGLLCAEPDCYPNPCPTMAARRTGIWLG